MMALFALVAPVWESPKALWEAALSPPTIYRPVPLWWWDGERLDIRRLIWQLDRIRRQGVLQVCPIYRSPLQASPRYFSEDWWRILLSVVEAAERRGMKVWLYDQIGFGSAGWIQRVASENSNWQGQRLRWIVSPPLSAGESWEWEIPEGAEVLGILAVPLSGRYQPERGIDLTSLGKRGRWRAPEGRSKWKVYAFYVAPGWMDFLNQEAAARLIDLVHGEFARRLKRYFGTVVVGTFQDELRTWQFPPWSALLAGEFRKRKGYDITRWLPLLLRSSDPQRLKVRCDYWDVVVSMVERAFFRPLFKWHKEHGLLSSHDQWGRLSLQRQLQFYGDYMRTMRWFTVPGYDDWGPPRPGRNWRDAKMASSLARLYRRPFVWLEAYHSSGWGLSLDDCHSMTAENFLYGATLFDLHGFYYTTYGGWWEWAPPSGLFRQPYFAHSKPFSDWVTRTGFLLAQGESVVPVAVLYPIATVQAHTALDGEVEPEAERCERLFWGLSKAALDSGYDVDFVDEDSISRGILERRYKALVLPGTTVVRRSTLWRILSFIRGGGTAIVVGALPEATVEGGKGDWLPRHFCKEALGGFPSEGMVRRFGRGKVAFLPEGEGSEFVKVLKRLVPRDFEAPTPTVKAIRRRAGGMDIFYVANLSDDPVEGWFRFRAQGFPQLWDLERGRRWGLPFKREGERVSIPLRLEGRQTAFVVFGEGKEPLPVYRPHRVVSEVLLDGWWGFKVEPTLDNRWGDFRLPAFPGRLGPEVRRFKYRAEPEGTDGEAEGWWRPHLDDHDWEEVTYSVGQLWWISTPLPSFAENEPHIALAHPPKAAGKVARWEPYAFSKIFGVEKDPIHRRTLGPKGVVPDEFLVLGRAKPGSVRYALTFVHVPQPMEAVLVAGSRGPFCVWLDGRIVAKGREGAVFRVRLRQGWHRLLVRLVHGEGPLRAYVHLLPPEEGPPCWIWYPEEPAGTASRFFRQAFWLPARPRRALLIVTADNGYEVFVNGRRVGAELGPGSSLWKRAERFEVERLLRRGRNVVAVRATNLGGPAGLLLLLEVLLPSGRKVRVATDSSWRCSRVKEPGWNRIDFDDSHWLPAKNLGAPPVQPWGRIEGMSPLPSEEGPRLRWFKRPLPMVLDPLPFVRKRVGWFRFTLPPGAEALSLRVSGRARIWVNGTLVGEIKGGGRVGLGDLARMEGAVCALRVEMAPGVWGGAALEEPVRIKMGWGLATLGDWREKGLRCYSGMALYGRRFMLPEGWAGRKILLDLGEVRATAEVWVNGKRAGVRAWRPYRFDLSRFVREGENELLVRVANTLANHYAVALPSPYVYPDSDRAGLLGPVRLILAK